MDSFSQLIDGVHRRPHPGQPAARPGRRHARTLVGVLPGIGPALAVALLLPITFTPRPTGALILFAGIYYGGMYGGSTTRSCSTHPARVLDGGCPRGQQDGAAGRGAPALATAAIGSFVAGTIATILLTFLAQPIADIASKHLN